MKTIIVVDDDLDISRLISFRLKKVGYNALIANNGKTALTLLKDTQADLILLDLRMPVMDGFEFSKVAKKDENLKDIPIIILTASNTTQESNQIQEINARGFFKKPFDFEEVLETIKDVIGN